MTATLTSVSLANMATGPWTDAENDLIVADYFAMLAADLAGRPYNKAEHNQRLRSQIDRSRPSIEFKHRNISAVLKGLGEGIVKLTDCRLFSAFFHEAKPLKLRKAAIDNLPRFWSESS